MPADRVSRLPLSALLSQVLVAFTIECDNQFELQMPHRTSNYGSTAGLFSTPGDGPRPTPEPRPDAGSTPAPEPVPPSNDLPGLLSRVLLALAIEFERESSVSLAICADVLRVLDRDGPGS